SEGAMLPSLKKGSLFHRVLRARPYSALAHDYDVALGLESFRRTKRLFNWLVKEFLIPFDSAADVGCGTGLFARYLSGRLRVPVFGLDQSRGMLRMAKRNCRGARVRLFHQDLRSMKFPSPVHLVTANFETINYLVSLGDLEIALKRIAESLRPDGHFIFDF